MLIGLTQQNRKIEIENAPTVGRLDKLWHDCHRQSLLLWIRCAEHHPQAAVTMYNVAVCGGLRAARPTVGYAI